MKTIKTKYGLAYLRKDGYYQISSRGEGNHHKFLHRLVYEDNYGPIPEGYHVHHLDGDKTNNDITNLVIMNASEHIKEHMNNRISNWKICSGENHYLWKDYPRIIKVGKENGKQRYGLIYDGKQLKRSIHIHKLLDYAKQLGLDDVEVMINKN